MPQLSGPARGLCLRGGETATDDFSIGDNLPVPVASRTVPGDPIRKRVFLSAMARERDWSLSHRRLKA
jgi:hypothetical protein